ncbi:hypothetical protein VE00_04589 [Pseudogymnoascus sp. WSF 3629]|nr:hypothetical protein VE00_04589 [Pseudogymnoascus sp. WSF 3629]
MTRQAAIAAPRYEQVDGVPPSIWAANRQGPSTPRGTVVHEPGWWKAAHEAELSE